VTYSSKKKTAVSENSTDFVLTSIMH